ncbi:MAG: lysine 2,3-aminomutase [Nannocystaceae bacterium]
MLSPAHDQESRYRAITRANIESTPEWDWIPRELQEAVRTVSTVLPFRTNRYVMRELIDWERVPADPIFQLTFVQPDMLDRADYVRMRDLLHAGADKAAIKQAADEIRYTLNPHPAGQTTHNVPTLDGHALPGMQHKYRETVLFFPGQGQTCHAYCTFCFRWAQFVGLDAMKFEARETDQLTRYLRAHTEVTDVLITGGDPMVMNAASLERYLLPLLAPELDHVQNIRIGTKSVAYWPHRFVTDKDADQVLRLFERIVAAGKHLAVMGHYNHPTELGTDIAQTAVRRIRTTGAQIRMQSPLVRHINDDASTWAEMWRAGVKLGAIPYYMFVERDTGPRGYFEVPLERAWNIFRDAYQQVSGLARTVRGPSMSAFPGKVSLVGVSVVRGEKVFVLEFLQARDPDWVRRPFFAAYDPDASWMTDLRPAFGESRFFFEDARPASLRVLNGRV